MKVLLLADIHLGASLPAWGPRSAERAQTLLDSFGKAIEMARESAVDAVVIAGDLFDSPQPDESLLESVGTLFESLAQEDIPVVISPGYFDSWNHPNSVYREPAFPANVRVIDWDTGQPQSIETKAGDLHIYGNCDHGDGFANVDWSGFKRTETPGVHLGVFPGELDLGTRVRAGARSLSSAELGDLNLDWVVMGGRHNYQEYEIGNTTFVYPGALCGLTYGDWDERFLVFANLDDHVKNIDPRVWDAPPIVEEKLSVTLKRVSDEASLAEYLAEKFSGVAMARITLTGTAPYPFDLDKVEDQLPEGAPLFDLIDDTDLDDALSGSAMQQRFVARIREEMEGADTATKKELRHALRVGVAHFRELEVSDAA